MKDESENFESVQKISILLSGSGLSHRIHWLTPPTAMENPVDRAIRLMALAAGVVSLLVFAVLHFV